MNGYWFSADDNKPKHPLEPLDPVPPFPAPPEQPPAAAVALIHYCYSPLKPGVNGLHFGSDLTSAIRLGNFGPICWSVSMAAQTAMASATWGCASQREYLIRKDFAQPLINALNVIRASLDPINKFHVRAGEEMVLAQTELTAGNRVLAWTLAQQALVDCMASNTRRIHPGTDWESVEAALQAAWLAAP